MNKEERGKYFESLKGTAKGRAIYEEIEEYAKEIENVGNIEDESNIEVEALAAKRAAQKLRKLQNKLVVRDNKKEEEETSSKNNYR